MPTCIDCNEPIVPSATAKPNQPGTGHCACPDSAWVFPVGHDPRKLVVTGTDLNPRDPAPGVRGEIFIETREGRSRP